MPETQPVQKLPLPPTGTVPLARKPNYSFEKRKRELDRKAKKDARDENRRRRRAEGLPADEEQEGAVPADEGTSQPEGAEARPDVQSDLSSPDRKAL